MLCALWIMYLNIYDLIRPYHKEFISISILMVIWKKIIWTRIEEIPILRYFIIKKIISYQNILHQKSQNWHIYLTVWKEHFICDKRKNIVPYKSNYMNIFWNCLHFFRNYFMLSTYVDGVWIEEIFQLKLERLENFQDEGWVLSKSVYLFPPAFELSEQSICRVLTQNILDIVDLTTSRLFSSLI